MSSVSDAMMRFSNVGFSYERGKPLINALSFSIENGEFIGLLGANGSGKSTIMKLAGGLLKISGGALTLWGKSMNVYSHKDRAKLISYLPQTLDINIPFTIRELAAMGLYPYDIMPELTVDNALGMVGLSEKAGSLLTSLSGGEKRRAFIAMTLLQGAGLLLLDEPLANLDIKYQIELIRLLKELREKYGITVVMALHEINAALQFDRIMLIKNGRIVGDGTPDSVLTEELIREAFDVEVEIKREDTGEVYIKY